MKRRSFLQIIFVMIFALALSACSIPKDVNIKSIVIDEKSIPEFIVAGEFDEAGIKAIVTYEDDTSQIIEVNSKLLKDAYQDKINKAGEYEIEILLKGQSTKFKVKIIDAVGVHVVKFFNGLNELVSMQVVKDGEAAIAPSGKSHLIKGYEFLGWDRKFDNVKEDMKVFGIYAKIDEITEEVVNPEYREELFKAIEKMREVDVNVLEIWDLVARRFEKTLRYDNQELKSIVRKEIDEDKNIVFHKYAKEYEGSLLKYVYEKYDEDGFYSKIDIPGDEFDQYDIYARVKAIVSSTDIYNYSLLHMDGEKLYKFEATIPNAGDGNYQSETIEILFNDEQIISLKRYLNFMTPDAMIEKKLSTSEYFEIEPENIVIFPKDLDLGEIVSEVFNHDVIIDIYELRDELALAKVIKNDAQNRASKISEGNEENYMWDKDIATYYTKQVHEAGMVVNKVYKTIASENRYGNMFYYEWKDLANSSSSISVENGRVEIMFRVEETSSSRAHNVVFVIEDGKLVEFEKHYYNANELIVMERMELFYEDVEVFIPNEFIASEDNAILE